jgi:hypothetical protein
MTERCRLASSPHRVLIVLGLYFLSVFSALSAPLLAQTIRVTGQVVNADSAPVGGVRVTLHQVARDLQGPLDSAWSNGRGAFRLTLRPDTAALYLVSARYAGIEYFSSPVDAHPGRPADGVRIVVYDTSSSAPVSLTARHLVLTRPAEDGSRTVLDVIILRNGGRLTRVASDTVRGSWSVPLPQGTVGLQVNESDVSAEAVRRSGDSLIVHAALAPGEKQLTVQYQLPSQRKIVELPLDTPGILLNVLVEEPGVSVAAPGVVLADSQEIAGRSFQRWTGTVTSSGRVRLFIPAVGRSPVWLLAALVGGLGLGLIAIGWYALASRQRGRPRSAPDDLVDAIAALDARYLGRRDQTAEDEWKAYEVERARLKGELEAALAAGGWSR